MKNSNSQHPWVILIILKALEKLFPNSLSFSKKSNTHLTPLTLKDNYMPNRLLCVCVCVVGRGTESEGNGYV